MYNFDFCSLLFCFVRFLLCKANLFHLKVAESINAKRKICARAKPIKEIFSLSIVSFFFLLQNSFPKNSEIPFAKWMDIFRVQICIWSFINFYLQANWFYVCEEQRRYSTTDFYFAFQFRMHFHWKFISFLFLWPFNGPRVFPPVFDQIQWNSVFRHLKTFKF